MNMLLDHEPTVQNTSVEKGWSSSSWLAGLWTLGTFVWAAMTFVQLRITAALIELAGLHRGAPIDGFEHFSELPELDAAVRSSTLTVPTTVSFVMMLTLISATGAAISARVWHSKIGYSRRILNAMAAVWILAVLVGLTHYDTLDLLTWLDN